MSLKILVISSTVYPDMNPRSYRTSELIRQLSYEDKVTLVCWNSTETTEFLKKYGINQINYSSINGLFGVIIRKFIKSKSRILNFVVDLFLDFPSILYYFYVKKLKVDLDQYDAVITIAHPHSIHWGFNYLYKHKKRKNLKWIADCGDPFMGLEIDRFSKPFYFRYFEKNFCKNVNFLTVPVENAVIGYYPEFRNKIKVISQGFNLLEVITAENILSSTDGIRRFAFAGTIKTGGRNGLDFIEYLKSVKSQFEFHIYSSQFEIIEPMLEFFPNKLFLHKPKARLELIYELSEMDFLINFKNSSLRQLPSKLIDYSFTNRPILDLDPKSENQEDFIEFLNGNYNAKYQINKFDFDIVNIANEFRRLIKS